MYSAIEPVILSGTDGVITCFNLMVGLGAADFNKELIFIIIMIAIIGDSISMAISYLNSKLLDSNQILDLSLWINSFYNILSFVFFGGLCLAIYLMITKSPSVINAYIAIIIPLLILGILQMMYRDGNVSFFISLILGMIGSVISYFFGKMIKEISKRMIVTPED